MYKKKEFMLICSAIKYNACKPGKGYPSILTSISATAYGAVLHSKCKAYLKGKLVRFFQGCP